MQIELFRSYVTILVQRRNVSVAILRTLHAVTAAKVHEYFPSADQVTLSCPVLSIMYTYFQCITAQ
jgi:hypothetical protein